MVPINLLGAPGCGKSTTMLGLTYQMKMMGLNVENTPEFFKDLVLEESDKSEFGGQLYVLGEQNRRLARLKHVDFAVTDCPLPLVGYYTSEDYIPDFQYFVQNLFNTYNNVNYLIVRNHEFESEKRLHNEDEAKKVELELPVYLKKHGIEYKVMESGEDLVERILADLINTNIITKEHLQKSRNSVTRKKYSV